MPRLRHLCLILLMLCTVAFPLSSVHAIPSSDFDETNGYWFDDWGINRNYYAGRNGYLPDMAYETLDENKELAFSIGESFKERYASETERAVAILKYVQKWTDYGYDEENVFRDGVAQDEWAWNADEMAHAYNEDTGVKAIGDCEDLAFFCATIYKGADFDAAIVDAPGHVALLIWLPEFSNADNYWNIPDDNRGAGWIWVEATGNTNPLGWTPPDYDDGDWDAYPLGEIEPIAEPPQPLPFDLIIIALVIIAIVALSTIATRARSKKANYTYTYLPPPPPPPPDY